ncbi:uncharacterized protein LOC135155823 [Lytechinus pictus]|uniref:uncharacterized protein LOC135155823 n=1 Tax=Lytechinus pictus TaxID=7653 RepID=UPI0030B9BB15
MSPETVFGRGFKLLDSSFVKENLCAIVVDESHCIVKWGQNSDRLKAFRSEYGRLAELRSMVPSQIPVVALTATSTIATRKNILTSLTMTQPALITLSPDRKNIKYSVMDVPESDTSCIFAELCNELKRDGRQTARTIIFARSHNQCSDLYKSFKKKINDVNLFAMFHLTTEDCRKEEVLKSFGDENGSIRVLFATMAFGMGVNCRGVRRVYHLGPPEDIEDYVQESGRVGRDGEDSHAVLILFKGWNRCKVSPKMKEYVKNEEICRRKFLMETFEEDDRTSCKIIPHSCCDICAQKCECRVDDAHTIPFKYCDTVQSQSQHMTTCRDVSDEEREVLLDQLLLLRGEVLARVSGAGYTLAGADVTSGIPISEVEALVKNCDKIDSLSTLCNRFSFFGHEEEIWIVLEDTLPPSQTSQSIALQELHPTVIDDIIDTDESDTNDEYAEAVLMSDAESDN